MTPTVESLCTRECGRESHPNTVPRLRNQSSEQRPLLKVSFQLKLNLRRCLLAGVPGHSVASVCAQEPEEGHYESSDVDGRGDIRGEEVDNSTSRMVPMPPSRRQAARSRLRRRRGFVGKGRKHIRSCAIERTDVLKSSFEQMADRMVHRRNCGKRQYLSWG